MDARTPQPRDELRPACRRARRAHARRSAFAAWAMSGCRSPWRHGTPGFRVIAFDTDPEKIDAAHRRRFLSEAHRAGEARGDGRRRALRADRRFRPPRRVRRDHHLRADAARPRTASRTCRYVEKTAQAIAERLRPGQLVDPGIDDLSGHDGGDRRAGSGGERTEAGQRLSSSPIRRSARTPATANFTTKQVPKVVGGMGEDARDLACALLRQLHRTRRAGLLGRGRRKRSRSPRTSSAPSTSRWSTS